MSRGLEYVDETERKVWGVIQVVFWSLVAGGLFVLFMGGSPEATKDSCECREVKP